MVGSSWMEDKPDLQSWVAILLTVEGQSPSLPADEHCLVERAGGVLLAGSGVLVVGAAEVQSGTPGWVGKASGLPVGMTLIFELYLWTGG